MLDEDFYMKYDYNNISKYYSVREISRGKTSQMIKDSKKQPVVVIKNSKPVSVVISYENYMNLKNMLKF